MAEELIREGHTTNGHRVTLTRVVNGYQDAQPYYAVGRHLNPKNTHPQRFTPSLERAEALYRAMVAGITDAQRLKDAR